MPKKIFEVPQSFILVVGHAYGSHKESLKRGDLAISPKVSLFYKKYKKNINAIVFSGDVLKNPSLSKWKNFYNSFPKDLPIYIAPGNHDVSNIDSATRDVFELTKHKSMNVKKFPFVFDWKNNLFVLDDSNVANSSIKKIFSQIKDSKKFQTIYIIRHHVLPKSLERYANGKGPQSYLDSSELMLEGNIADEKNINFIYGDGGAFVYQPRITCLKIGNINHIVNGIGDLPGDTVLIITENNIYRKEI